MRIAALVRDIVNTADQLAPNWRERRFQREQRVPIQHPQRQSLRRENMHIQRALLLGGGVAKHGQQAPPLVGIRQRRLLANLRHQPQAVRREQQVLSGIGRKAVWP